MSIKLSLKIKNLEKRLSELERQISALTNDKVNSKNLFENNSSDLSKNWNVVVDEWLNGKENQ